MANLIVAINASSSDSEYGTSGVDWVDFSEGNDKLIFSAGNTAVADGADIPTESELISAGIQLTDPLSEIIVSEYFLQDTGSNILKDIDLMGNQDTQYVMAFSFDASTASEPVLEVWDDDNLNTITSTLLGGGTPSNSMVRGITTTSASAGSGWATTTGIKMAGSGSGNFLFLNDENGALTEADVLYCNLAIVIPSSQALGFSGNPVFSVKWLDS